MGYTGMKHETQKKEGQIQPTQLKLSSSMPGQKAPFTSLSRFILEGKICLPHTHLQSGRSIRNELN